MKTESNDKQDLIIEAAIRRFSHFGMHKTTLTEIADDVALSKQALAHYFTDKQSLIMAVVEQIFNGYLQQLEQNCQQAPSVEAALLQLTEIKRAHFERYYMLYLQNRNTDLKIGASDMWALRQKLRTRELNVISAMLEKGVHAGEIRPVDVRKAGGLVLDTLAAFECALKIEKVLPDHHDFLSLINKQKDVLHLFINGLKKGAA